MGGSFVLVLVAMPFLNDWKLKGGAVSEKFERRIKERFLYICLILTLFEICCLKIKLKGTYKPKVNTV